MKNLEELITTLINNGESLSLYYSVRNLKHTSIIVIDLFRSKYNFSECAQSIISKKWRKYLDNISTKRPIKQGGRYLNLHTSKTIIHIEVLREDVQEWYNYLLSIVHDAKNLTPCLEK